MADDELMFSFLKASPSRARFALMTFVPTSCGNFYIFLGGGGGGGSNFRYCGQHSPSRLFRLPRIKKLFKWRISNIAANSPNHRKLPAKVIMERVLRDHYVCLYEIDTTRQFHKNSWITTAFGAFSFYGCIQNLSGDLYGIKRIRAPSPRIFLFLC